MAPSASSRSTETSTARAGSAKLSEHERLSLWKTLLLKVSLVLQTVAQQTKVKYLLGEAVFNKWFLVSPIPEPQVQAIKYRFIKGQAVGKPRPQGEGKVDKTKAHMDPAMCQHPDDKMKPRGNKGDKWWLCSACLNRWDRLEMSELNLSEGSMDLSILKFGKHMGSTFMEVYHQDRAYCQWILETVENGDPSTEIHQFAQYLHSKALEETYEMDSFNMPMDQDL